MIYCAESSHTWSPAAECRSCCIPRTSLSTASECHTDHLLESSISYLRPEKQKKNVSSEHKTNVNNFENRYKIHVYRQSSETYFISLTLRSLISTSLAFGIFKLSSVWHLVCLIFLKDFKFYFRFKRGAFYFIMTTFRGSFVFNCSSKTVDPITVNPLNSKLVK